MTDQAKPTSKESYLCERNNCREKINDDCAYRYKVLNFEQKLCALCYLAEVNNMERKSRQLNDDDFCFDVSPSMDMSASAMDDDRSMSAVSTRSNGGSFQKTTVRRNAETGEI